MRSLRSTSAALLVLTAFVTTTALPRGAFAQSDADKATARELGKEGQAALDKKDFKTAEDCFKRADALFHAPTLALGLARAYTANGKYVAAQETYNRIIREGAPANAPPAFAKAVEDAKGEVEKVSPKVGSVVIVVNNGPDAPKVTLDDQPVPVAALGVKRPADPGAHTVKATAEGYKPVEATVSITEGGSATATLTMEKDPNAVASTEPVAGAGPAAYTTQIPQEKKGPMPLLRLAGWIGLGAGGASLIVGAITGGIAAGKSSDLKKNCPDNVCPSDQQDAVDSYNSMATVSTITLVAGGVLAAAGAVLLIVTPAHTHEAAPPVTGFRMTPVLGVGSAGVTGQF